MKPKDDENHITQAEAEIYPHAFLELPARWQDARKQTVVPGAANGVLDTRTADSGMIQAANRTAGEWAAEHAAETVGMKYDAEGNLIANPKANWAISETTRDELRRIVTESFGKETDMRELIQRIREAGAFSEACAKFIAQTEVSLAQCRSNYAVWRRSGVVKKVKWGVSSLHKGPCACDLNRDMEVALGKPFPSGVYAPPQHPGCRCVIWASEIAG
ncbi:MAG: hypothetical protein ACYDA9_20680 [Terriglobia bacterium]